MEQRVGMEDLLRRIRREIRRRRAEFYGLRGAFWGGMTIGLVQQMSTLILQTQLQNAAIFVVFLLIIFFRPQGMFGRLSERT